MPAYQDELRLHPNYGRNVGIDPPKWWDNVITKTFSPFLPKGQTLPTQFVPDLINRFATKDGYTLYPDVLPFFDMLRNLRNLNSAESVQNQQSTQTNHTSDSISTPSSALLRSFWPWKNTIVAIISNSDCRVPGILSSFGLRVVPCAHTISQYGRGEKHPGLSRPDISFVVLSYDVGHEKPDRKIFDAATAELLKTLAERSNESGESKSLEDFEMLYVGDDLKKDVFGATEAGWHAILVDRIGSFKDYFIKRHGVVSVSLGSGLASDDQRRVQVIKDLEALSDWRPNNNFNGDSRSQDEVD